jgi:hypothetical protein
MVLGFQLRDFNRNAGNISMITIKGFHSKALTAQAGVPVRARFMLDF